MKDKRQIIDAIESAFDQWLIPPVLKSDDPEVQELYDYIETLGGWKDCDENMILAYPIPIMPAKVFLFLLPAILCTMIQNNKIDDAFIRVVIQCLSPYPRVGQPIDLAIDLSIFNKEQLHAVLLSLKFIEREIHCMTNRMPRHLRDIIRSIEVELGRR